MTDISEAFDRCLDGMSVVYNFEYGEEFEIAVCETLRRILPRRYGVSRGFVVGKNGDTAGDDIIIYDADSFPSLRFNGNREDLALKGRIPVDAVYAYIEAKHTLTPKTLSKAILQVMNVKRLCYTRNHMLHNDADSYAKSSSADDGLHIFDNDFSRNHGWNPIITTAVYGMILSRHCSWNSRGESVGGEEAVKLIVECLNDEMRQTILEGKVFCPESIVVGNHANAICGHYLFNSDGSGGKGINITRFYTGVQPYACYQVNAHEGKSFGIAIAHMLWSLDYIRLGKMPWAEIFNTAKIPNEEERTKLLELL